MTFKYTGVDRKNVNEKVVSARGELFIKVKITKIAYAVNISITIYAIQ